MRKILILVIAVLIIIPALPCYAKDKPDKDDTTDCQIQLKQKDLELVTEKLNRISVEFAYMQEHSRTLQRERALLLSDQKRLQKEIAESQPKKD